MRGVGHDLVLVVCLQKGDMTTGAFLKFDFLIEGAEGRFVNCDGIARAISGC